ncbi:hypothetical protein [Methanobrevibacter woesei]|uniref:hypothetical protein n=1 Tax=Methanobrevibacter woesei TaxID=190976 RepID=UPI00320A8DD0
MNDEDFNKFTPLDFLELAVELDKFSDELNIDNSVVERNIFGRLYYSSFLYVREWLSKHWKYKSKGPRDHTTMPNFIKSKGPFGEVENNLISDLLLELKKLRHQSDYYLEIPEEGTDEYKKWIFEDVDYAFNSARYIIDSFKKLNIK